MSAQRTERLLNVVQVLLSQQQPLTKARFHEVIEDYRNSPSGTAFERMFERDKESLRDLGINIETVAMDAWHEDEFGYRLDHRSARLAPMELSADEIAVLNIAARVWDQAALGPAAQTALHKLEAIAPEGVGERDLPRLIEPRLDTSDDAFPAMVRATTERRRISFNYRKPGQAEIGERHIEPWRVVLRRWHWYVIGLDRDRDEARVFRLSRVVGDVVLDNERGSYAIPADLDVSSVSPDPDSRPEQQGLIRVRANTCHRLRRDARGEPINDQVAADRVAANGDDSDGDHSDWELLSVPFRGVDSFASVIAGCGADAIVESPPDLRERVVALLSSAAGER